MALLPCCPPIQFVGGMISLADSRAVADAAKSPADFKDYLRISDPDSVHESTHLSSLLQPSFYS